MKVAIAYRGIFNRNKLGDEVESRISYAKSVLDNHRKMLINYLCWHEIDFYFSTYDVQQKEMDEMYIKELNPKSYTYIPTQFLHGDCWTAQWQHYKNLISNIKNQNKSYDLFIFTRPDIEFLKSFDEMNINEESFNIIIEHLPPHKNCDDNFWVFPGKFFEGFENSVNTLSSRNRITHEMNHELVKNSIPINYITPYDNSVVIGHKIFKFCR